MTNLDIIGFAAATLTTFCFLPQNIRIIRTKKTSDISLVMYLMFAIGLFLWLLYGIMQTAWPIILSNIITLILVIPIIILKIRYK